MKSFQLDRDQSPDALNRRAFLRWTASAVATGAIASAIPSLEALAVGDPRKIPPVYTQGFYKPQLKETTATTMRVRGAIPDSLAGRYFRNGHNPPPDLVKSFWFGGHGMIHGVRVKNGKAEWYRNRFVQTPALKGAKLFRPDGTMDLKASAAATSVYAHAGKIFALQEVNLPYLVTPELETIGAYDFDGALKTMMTAHPKIDPFTGEMLFLGNSPVPPYLTYYVADKTGKLVHTEVIEGPGPSVMHDFAITKNYVAWFDPSVILDPTSKLGFPYAWSDTYQARIGIMPRDRSQGKVRWFDIPSYYFFHLSNAYEDAQGRVVIEGTSYDRAGWEHSSKWISNVADHGKWVVGGSRWTRWIVDLQNGRVDKKVMDDLSLEFPVINYGHLSRQTRYTYAPIFPFGPEKNTAIVKYDDKTGQRDIREFRAGLMPGEAYFAPDPNGTAEDDGWLFTYVSDINSHRSELWVLDATNIKAPPTAVIELPAWVPAGVHGSWIPDSALAG